MGRSRRPKSDSEISDNKRLKLENQKLKKQISSLRKQLARIDLDRYSYLKDVIEAHEQEDQEFDVKISLEEEKRKWECFDCHDGVLRLIMLSKAGEPFYFRRCDNCAKKTKLKKFTESVQGIKSED